MEIERKFLLPQGLVLETAIVDKGTDCSFAYAEVEFPDVETALSWEPLDCLGEEITYNPNYKMKNYWRRTR